MLRNMGHVLLDDVVVDYKNTDRDDCLHFLTHLDTSCKDLSLFISPTAKRIYTSIFNAWFLKMNFDVKHIDIQGFDTNKSYKITFKGNKYIYSFIDSKYTTGSVALLLHGAFGTYLYTGSFCYSPSFLSSPVLVPVIEEKALTRLYLDNTYYEQPSNFLGFDELSTKVAALIKSQPMKNFYIYADKVTMDPILADIASKLEERVYVCQSTMEIMKILGYESCFTRHSNESRIFIDKAFIKKRGYGLENIAIYINRYSESCKSFQKIEKRGNVYTFNFYCHSNHKEICELLRILKPESMTFLFSEIDKSKLSYDFKFKYDLPRTVLFNGISTKPSINVEDNGNNVNIKNIPKQLIKPSITNDKYVDKYFDNEDKNSVKKMLENHSGTNLSTDYICPLRIRKVPEINNTGLCNKLNHILDDGDNKVAENEACDNKLSYNSSNEINSPDRNTSNFSVQSHSSSKSLHNYAKQRPNNSIGFMKLENYDSAEKTLISSTKKSLPSYVVQTKTGVPLVFHSRLVKENRLNGVKSKVMQISNIGVAPIGQKNTILLNNKYVGVNKPLLISVPGNGVQKTKLNDLENGNDIVTKMSTKSKTADSNSNLKRPNALLQPSSNVLNLTKLFHDWIDNDMGSVPKDSFQRPENSVDRPEESISVESHNFDRDCIQLVEPLRNNTTINNKRNSDSLVGSINLQKQHDINQPCKIPTEFHQLRNQGTCNGKTSDNNSSMTTKRFVVDKRTTNSSPLKKSVVDNRVKNSSPLKKNVVNSRVTNSSPLKKSVVDNIATNATPCKSTNDQELEPLNENTLLNDESKFCGNNCQDAIKASTVNSKRHLPNNENGQLRKKLRSDNLRQCVMKSSWQQKEDISLRHCSILIVRNSFEKSYFYSSKNNCYLPKFFGFKKHEIRPRNMLATLRNLQKLTEIKCN